MRRLPAVQPELDTARLRLRALVAAFALPENAGKGVIALDGRMAERLHLARAERLLARRALSPLVGEMADRPEGV